MRTRTYPGDPAGQQWRPARHLIPVYPGGRPRRTSTRDALDAIFYLLKTGRRWRYRPEDFPPRSTAWRSFGEWRHNGTLGATRDRPREKARKQEGRARAPSAGTTDSPSVPATEGGEGRGYDAHETVTGRKRHVVVDALGLVRAVAVTAASADDGAAAQRPLARLSREEFPRRRPPRADSKYRNHDLYGRVAGNARYDTEVVRRPEGAKGGRCRGGGWRSGRSPG